MPTNILTSVLSNSYEYEEDEELYSDVPDYYPLSNEISASNLDLIDEDEELYDEDMVDDVSFNNQPADIITNFIFGQTVYFIHSSGYPASGTIVNMTAEYGIHMSANVVFELNMVCGNLGSYVKVGISDIFRTKEELEEAFKSRMAMVKDL